MILGKGEKIHVIHRPLFQGDVRRHFIGTVDACDGPLVRATGYLFRTDPKLNEFKRQGPHRTRVISLDSGSLIVNVLPMRIDVEKIVYKHERDHTTVTDGSDWHLEISHG